VQLRPAVAVFADQQWVGFGKLKPFAPLVVDSRVFAVTSFCAELAAHLVESIFPCDQLSSAVLTVLANRLGHAQNAPEAPHVSASR